MGSPTPPGRPGPVEWLSQRLLDVLPEPLAAHPERVLINVAAALIGVSGMVRHEGLSVIWPSWLIYEWSATMIIGGVAALVGIFRRATGTRSVERLGVMLILFAALFFGVNVLIFGGTRLLFTGLIFLGIAAAKTIRLLVSGAVRAVILQQAREDDEADAADGGT